MRGRAAAGLLLAALSGCREPAPTRVLACDAAPRPAVAVEGGQASTTLSVLTYNIEGLAWPARRNRAPSLARIGDTFAALHRAGRAPDVVLFQEMFSGPAKRAVAASGYRAIVPGPQHDTRQDGADNAPLPGGRSVRRGELGVKLVDAGLAIASRYPIVTAIGRPFDRRSCAGFDCLSNKGQLLARIAVPGVPVPVALYNIHMNARGASGAPPPRALAAHARQTEQTGRFLAETRRAAEPVIYGGDFNMRHSLDRWANFARYVSLSLVHQVCVDPTSGCDVRASWDGDAPWMDTQDLQLFEGGSRVAIRPIRVEAMFDGGEEPRLSDHDGLLVTYRLTWPTAAPVRNGCPQR